MGTHERRIKGVAGKGNRPESKAGSSVEVIASHVRESDHQHLNGGVESCGFGRLVSTQKQRGDVGCLEGTPGVSEVAEGGRE